MPSIGSCAAREIRRHASRMGNRAASASAGDRISVDRISRISIAVTGFEKLRAARKIRA